jgi:hypothetical protein
MLMWTSDPSGSYVHKISSMTTDAAAPRLEIPDINADVLVAQGTLTLSPMVRELDRELFQPNSGNPKSTLKGQIGGLQTIQPALGLPYHVPEYLSTGHASQLAPVWL